MYAALHTLLFFYVVPAVPLCLEGSGRAGLLCFGPGLPILAGMTFGLWFMSQATNFVFAGRSRFFYLPQRRKALDIKKERQVKE